MMRVKFNHFERVAGLFVLVAMLVMFFSLVGVSIKQGWFDSKTKYSTIFNSADGIHSGTEVQLAGLRAGAVTNVELMNDNRVSVDFWVFSKFDEKIKKDSSVTLIRPFIIGERILDVGVGSIEAEVAGAKTNLASHESMDFMTLMSGRTLGGYMSSMNEALGSMKYLAEAFLDKNRTESLVKTFDKLQPLIENVNTMSLEVIKLSRQATKDERLGRVMLSMAEVTTEINSMLPQIRQKAPALAKSMEQMFHNLAALTEQSKVLIPALAEVAPDLPRSSRRAVEALDEAVVLLKAMQKSFMIRSSAREVREEELAADIAAKKKKETEPRKPANKD